MSHPKEWANGGTLKMSAKERERLKVFERVKRGELQQQAAATLCQLEYRYLRRLYKRYCEQGDRGWCIKDAGDRRIECIRPSSIIK
jgi:hypothetical protein